MLRLKTDLNLYRIGLWMSCRVGLAVFVAAVVVQISLGAGVGGAATPTATGVHGQAENTSVAFEPLSEQDIDQAIEVLRAYLYEKQLEDGSWETPGGTVHAKRHHGGKTALVVLALLYSGDSFQSQLGEHGGVRAGLTWLEANEGWGTYTKAIRAHIWASLPDQFLSQLDDDGQYLLTSHRNGLFDYSQDVRPDRIDHSVTQYGVLGLWEYGKRGAVLPVGFWQQLVGHFLAAQRDDGGWNYDHSEEPSYGSMTTAGLTVLMVARQQLMQAGVKPTPELNQGIEDGLAWLDQFFSMQANPAAGEPHPHQGDRSYYWYGIERVGLASGRKQFNGLDWYQTGAASLTQELLVKDLSRVRARKNVVDISFALMFLVRGKMPVWCQKLSTPDRFWNAWPGDMSLLTQGLSDLYELPMNWAIVESDEPLNSWKQAPILWLSHRQGLPRQADIQVKIRDYLDAGGLLVVHPEGNRKAMASVQQFARKYFADFKFQAVSDDHPLMGLVYEVGHQSKKIDPRLRPWVLNNGARDLLVMFPLAWGAKPPLIQSEKTKVASLSRSANRSGGGATNLRGQQIASLQDGVLSNLFATYTMRGLALGQLVKASDVEVLSQSHQKDLESDVRSQRLNIWIGELDHAPLIEPNAWSTLIANGSSQGHDGVIGGELDWSTVVAQRIKVQDLMRRGDGGGADDSGDLLYLAGTYAVDLTEEELVAIEQFVQAGGKVWIETIGGVGGLGRRGGVREASDSQTSHTKQQDSDSIGQQVHTRFAPWVGRQIALQLEKPLRDIPLQNWCSKQQQRHIQQMAELDGYFRPWAIQQYGQRPKVSLRGVLMGQELLSSEVSQQQTQQASDKMPQILVCDQDMMLGALGVPHTKINGYLPQVAQALAEAVVYWGKL